MFHHLFSGIYLCSLLWNSRLKMASSTSSDLGRSPCGIQLFYLNTTLNQTMSVLECKSLGYDGIAILEKEDHVLYANDLIYYNNYQTPSNNIWFGLEFNSQEDTFGWRRDGLWVSYPQKYYWFDGEPDHMYTTQQCARIKYTPPLNITWGSWRCSKQLNAICQKDKSTTSKMTLFRKSVAPPVSSNVTATNSFLNCCLLCVSSCTCQAVHYSKGNCRLLNYYLLVSNEVITELSGDIYMKQI